MQKSLQDAASETPRGRRPRPCLTPRAPGGRRRWPPAAFPPLPFVMSAFSRAMAAFLSNPPAPAGGRRAVGRGRGGGARLCGEPRGGIGAPCRGPVGLRGRGKGGEQR